MDVPPDTNVNITNTDFSSRIAHYRDLINRINNNLCNGPYTSEAKVELASLLLAIDKLSAPYVNEQTKQFILKRFSELEDFINKLEKNVDPASDFIKISKIRQRVDWKLLLDERRFKFKSKQTNVNTNVTTDVDTNVKTNVTYAGIHPVVVKEWNIISNGKEQLTHDELIAGIQRIVQFPNELAYREMLIQYIDLAVESVVDIFNLEQFIHRFGSIRLKLLDNFFGNIFYTYTIPEIFTRFEAFILTMTRNVIIFRPRSTSLFGSSYNLLQFGKLLMHKINSSLDENGMVTYEYSGGKKSSDIGIVMNNLAYMNNRQVLGPLYTLSNDFANAYRQALSIEVVTNQMKDEKETCNICFVNVKQVVLSCGHRYCLDCVRNWVEPRGTCPECRQQVEIGRLL